MQWIKASERLPEGTKLAKYKDYKGTLEIKEYGGIFAAVSYFKVYSFSDSELYEIEWLDESDLPNEPSIQEEGKVEVKWEENMK